MLKDFPKRRKKRRKNNGGIEKKVSKSQWSQLEVQYSCPCCWLAIVFNFVFYLDARRLFFETI